MPISTEGNYIPLQKHSMICNIYDHFGELLLAYFKSKQDRQCMLNATQKHVHATIVAVEEQRV
jgi:hypothetical protein